uniref:Uncharacterized protein n=1 Tax=Trichogramma kaykai TaxID=54128 RepID=A0ABD2WRV5_9HYME
MLLRWPEIKKKTVKAKSAWNEVDISKEAQDKLTIPIHNQPYATGVHYSSTTYSCDALISHVESENLRARTTFTKDEHLQYRSYASGGRIRAGNDAARLYNYVNRRCSSCATAYIFNKSRALYYSVINVENFYQICVRQFSYFEKVAISITDIATLHFDSNQNMTFLCIFFPRGSFYDFFFEG